MSLKRRFLLLVLPLLLLTGFFMHMRTIAAAETDEGWKKELLSWRAKRAQNLQAPEGWLSLVGLDWLKAGDNTFGAAPDNTIPLPGGAPHLGILRLDHDTVHLLPAGGHYPDGLLVDGHGPASPQILATDAADQPSKITAQTLTMIVIRRGERFGLRTWDLQAPTRVNFHGLRWYDPDPRYRIEARWVPYDPPRQIFLATIVGTEEEGKVPGAAEFSLEGKSFRLEPVLAGANEQRLFFIFRDDSSKTETYQAARFLYTDLPDHGAAKPGKLVLDFNRAMNPPCAYTDFATCPLPPKGNVLAVAIAAGEKRYH